jgi:hypothetical protein
MDKHQARQIVAAAVLDAIDEMKLDSIVSNHNEDEQILLEDALDDLREDISQFGETSERLSDAAFEELLRNAPVSTPEGESPF